MSQPDFRSPLRAGLALALLCGLPSTSGAHPAGQLQPAETDSRGMRTWVDASGTFHFHGVLVSATHEVASIRDEAGAVVQMPLQQLSPADRQWIEEQVRADSVEGGLGQALALAPLVLAALALAIGAVIVRRGGRCALPNPTQRGAPLDGASQPGRRSPRPIEAAALGGALICMWASVGDAHPGHNVVSDGSIRVWIDRSGLFHLHGSFVGSRDGQVQIRREDDTLATLPLERLSDADQQWVRERLAEIKRVNLMSESGSTAQVTSPRLPGTAVLAAAAPTQLTRADVRPPLVAQAFEPFVKLKAIQTRWDDRFFFVESNGLPDHPMMVGITSWQQQVPLPQKYAGANAWRIPLHPTPAKNPATTANRFLRGAIALAVNGVPIFNPLNNRGDDAYLFGELDEYGGHCGRADDYHYHIAPVHLEKQVGKGGVIAYALDGYPIYGYDEPDGSQATGLDALNGHFDADGRYHYHATKKYPYLNGGFYGEVVERDGQVDPQPRAEPLRPALPPLQGAKIVGFASPRPTEGHLTYEIQGRKGSVDYTLAADGSVKFTFTDTQGRTNTQTYTPRPNGPSDRTPRDRPGPPRPRDNAPPPRESPATNTAPGSGAAAPPSIKASANSLTVTSPAIGADGKLPAEFTCDGPGVSPPVAWSGAPAGTKCFALSLWHIAPDQEKSYWLIYNIPAATTSLEKNTRGVGIAGLNDFRRTGYEPLCSKGPGQKKYHITVYALSAELRLPAEQVHRAGLLSAIKDLTLAEGTLDFVYERKK